MPPKRVKIVNTKILDIQIRQMAEKENSRIGLNAGGSFGISGGLGHGQSQVSFLIKAKKYVNAFFKATIHLHFCRNLGQFSIVDLL
jgi:hydrogenase/urease accessory protein HupE